MKGLANSTQEDVTNILYIANGVVVLVLAVTTCISSGILLYIIKSDPLRLFSTRPIVSFTIGSCYAHIFHGIFGLYFGISEILRAKSIVLESGDVLDFNSFTSLACTFMVTYRVFLSTSVIYERYIAFRFAHFHRRIVSTRNVFLLHVVLAFVLLIFTVVPLLDINEKAYYSFYLHMFVTVPLVALTANFCVQYWNMGHMNSVSSLNKDIPLRREQILTEKQRSITRSRKFIRIAVMNMIPLLISVMPWYSLMLTAVCCSEELYKASSRYLIHQRVAVSFTLVEALVTPLVYIRNADYRRTGKYILSRLRRR